MTGNIIHDNCKNLEYRYIFGSKLHVCTHGVERVKGKRSAAEVVSETYIIS